MPVSTIPVQPGPRRLDALTAAAGAEAVAAVRAAAEPLRGLRVVHVTTPPFAPQALDLLRATVPLLRDAGLDARWLVVAGDDEADAAARAVGDALRGGEAGPAAAEERWRRRGADAAAEVPRGTDVVVAHGAEGLALLGGARPAPAPAQVWWVEGDLSAGRPPPDLVAAADAVVAEREGWAPPGVPAEAIAPAIDPLAPGNLELAPRTAGALARAAGADLTRPFAIRTAPVDGWSDTERFVALARDARVAGAAELRLVVAARLPAGDPRAWRTLGELTDHTAGDEDVLVLADTGGAAAEVNALQRLARVALGAPGEAGALEAAWKGTPVAGDAERVARLVADPGLAVQEGRAARERVRSDRLVTRLLTDQLALYARITSGA